MIVHRIEGVFNDYYSAPDACELEEYELDLLPASTAEVWYWYGAQPYEGDGAMIRRDNNGLLYFDELGHCSCYGPTDNLSTHGHDCITDAQASGSADWWKVFAPLATAMEVDPR